MVNVVSPLTTLFALSVIPTLADAQNMTLPINISNKTSISNLSDTVGQGNLSKNINGTFNTSLANNAMMSNVL